MLFKLEISTDIQRKRIFLKLNKTRNNTLNITIDGKDIISNEEYLNCSNNDWVWVKIKDRKCEMKNIK